MLAIQYQIIWNYGEYTAGKKVNKKLLGAAPLKIYNGCNIGTATPPPSPCRNKPCMEVSKEVENVSVLITEFCFRFLILSVYSVNQHRSKCSSSDIKFSKLVNGGGLENTHGLGKYSMNLISGGEFLVRKSSHPRAYHKSNH